MLGDNEVHGEQAYAFFHQGAHEFDAHYGQRIREQRKVSIRDKDERHRYVCRVRRTVIRDASKHEDDRVCLASREKAQATTFIR